MEPLSIFSLTITILNILLNIIPSVIDKGEQIKNFAQRFNRYLETLEDCRMSMNVWVGRWEQENELEYPVLFGRIGWWRIQDGEAGSRVFSKMYLSTWISNPKKYPRKAYFLLKELSGRSSCQAIHLQHQLP